MNLPAWNLATRLETDAPMRDWCTLRAGGTAEMLFRAKTTEELCAMTAYAQDQGALLTVLGQGSNVLPSDDGIVGLVLINQARDISVAPNGEVIAETGCSFQDLFLAAAQHRLAGLEFAVGIPGTLGGALVSNAGAYRSNVSAFLVELEVLDAQGRRWVKPDYMQFSYRDSLLRRKDPPFCVLLKARFQLPSGEPWSIYDEAREYQRQRISKQPPQASAGSFFKNVQDAALANQIRSLPERIRAGGVVPAGYLIEAVGLRGYVYGRARFSPMHANFIVNLGGATATEIRRLAETAKEAVFEKFAVQLEEEVLYLGDWRKFR